MRSGVDSDPSRGGARMRFRTTVWTVVGEAGSDGPRRAAAWEQLCAIYWMPVYGFLRRSGERPEDAEDLTQEFFAWLIERDALAGLQREGARFSTYLLTLLKNRLRNEWERRRAKRRGGGCRHVSIDRARAELWLAADGADERPERAFERDRAQALVAAAMDELAAECSAVGKAAAFREMGCFLGREAAAGEYETVAGRLGLRAGTVAVAVHRLRRRFGEILRERLRAEGEEENELKALRECLR